MKLVTIIQARIGSSRLPGKVLKPLDNSDVLTYVVRRCRQINGVAEVIVATSNLPQDDVIANWCKANHVTYYRGSEQDVLDRYLQAAKPYRPDYVIRVTSDCPFVDYELANDLVSLINEHKVDIIDIETTLPRGLAVEIISYKALCRIYEISTEERHREHVTYYAYEYKDEFSRVSYIPKEAIQVPRLRITLDTEEDYVLCKAVAENFNNPLVKSSDVIHFLQEHPEIAKINAHIEQKPVM